jgi:uncharacterized GH25 family protein
MTMRQPGGLFLLLAVFSVRLAAHDYWLEPDRLSLAGPGTVTLRLLVGGNLQAEEERECQLARLPQCALVDAAGRRDLRPGLVEGAKPFGRVQLTGGGTHLIVLERTPSIIRLEADKFTAYLKEEGLDYIVAERARRGESAREGRERYARFLKCYVRTGVQPEAVRPAADLRLDIAPELRTDRAMQAGDELPVRVCFDGSPLKQAVVFAAVRRADGKVSTQRVMTDANGLARIRVTAAGLWVVRLVHMQRAPAGDAGVDWESFWAACTFGVT